MKLLNASSFANKINQCLERLFPLVVFFGIVLGFVLPGVFIHLRPYVFSLFGIMTFSGALKLKAVELGKAVKNPVPIILFFISAHVIMPFFAMLVSSFFFPESDITTGFILLFSAPTAVSGFIWVMILKGDIALCLALILLDTLLAPIVVPGTLSVLMGAKVSMDMSGIAVSLIFMVVIPTILAVGVNEISKGKVPAIISPYLNPFSKICLALVIAANASVIAPGIKLTDPFVWKVASVCILLIITGFLIAKLASLIGKHGEQKSVTMIFCGGLRNNSAISTILVAFFPEAAALPALLSILFQQTIAAIAGKIMVRNKPARG